MPSPSDYRGTHVGLHRLLARRFGECVHVRVDFDRLIWMPVIWAAEFLVCFLRVMGDWAGRAHIPSLLGGLGSARGVLVAGGAGV